MRLSNIGVIAATALSCLPASAADIQFAGARNGRTGFQMFAPHDSRCMKGTSDAVVSMQPRNGRIEIERPMTTLTQSGYPACVGKRIEAVAFYYIPNRNFTGNDRLQITVTEPGANGPARYTYDFVAVVK